MDAAHSTPRTPVAPLGGPLPSLDGRSAVYADDSAASGVNTSHNTGSHTDPSPALDGHHTSGLAATVSSPVASVAERSYASTLRAQLLRLADQAQRVAAALPTDLQAANAPHAERLLSLAAEHLERAAVESIGLPREVLKGVRPTPSKGR